MASSCISSQEPRSTNASTCSCASSRTTGSKSLIARGVNLRLTAVRNSSCSGLSIAMSVGAGCVSRPGVTLMPWPETKVSWSCTAVSTSSNRKRNQQSSSAL